VSELNGHTAAMMACGAAHLGEIVALSDAAELDRSRCATAQASKNTPF